MDRDDQRRGQRGEKEIAPRVVVPLALFAGPAQAQDGKYPLAGAGGPVAYGCQVRHQPGVPEQGAHRQVGADGHHVEHER